MSLIATLLCSLSLLASPEIPVHAGAKVTLDGKIDAAEWAGAFKVTRDVFGDNKLHFHLMRSGPWLAIGIDATGPYRGEVLRLYVADLEGDWVTAVHCGLAHPSLPPMLWRRGHPQQLRNRMIPPEAPRGCRVRVQVEKMDSWSAECLIRLDTLGIGRGDLRKFGAFLTLGIAGTARRVYLTLPADVEDPFDPGGFARLVSEDGWGKTEKWEPVSEEVSLEFDDHALLTLLFLEHEGFQFEGRMMSAVIQAVVHQRTRPGIEALRRRLLDGQRRNPGLPSYRYYLARLLLSATLYDEVAGMLEALPLPMRELDQFVRLAAEYHYYLGEWKKAIAYGSRRLGALGMGELVQSAKQGIELGEAETTAIAADEAKAEKNPRARFHTTKGAFTVELFEDDAPNAVFNFVNLVWALRYYDGVRIHDANGAHFVTLGDPRTRGGIEVAQDQPDGPPWRLRPDASQRPLLRGYLALVPRPGGVFHGSHFTIALAPLMREGAKTVVFGRVVEGMEIVDDLDFADRVERIEMLRKRNHNYDPLACRVQ